MDVDGMTEVEEPWYGYTLHTGKKAFFFFFLIFSRFFFQ